MSNGTFITFEGGEGSGKSTQLARIAEHLKDAGRNCVLTREPGGTRGADAVRELLVNGSPDRWSATSEALLNYAARDDHVRRLIQPALEAGKTVLCDRFVDSTWVYQGYAGDAEPGLLMYLQEKVVSATMPDLTFVFDLDPAVGLERARTRGGADRFERKGLAYHQKLREGFRKLCEAEKNRCVLVDASAEEETITAELLALLTQRLGL